MLDNILKEAKEKTDSSYVMFTKDLNSIRTGKANASLLDGVVVDIEDGKMKLSQLGNIAIINNKTLSVNLWDKAWVSAAKNAIIASHLGLNIAAEGQVIRLTLPELTEERRKELIKAAKTYAERARITSRNIRRDYITKLKSLEKEKAISEDEMHSYIKKIDKDFDKIDKEIDSILEKKEKELITV